MFNIKNKSDDVPKAIKNLKKERLKKEKEAQKTNGTHRKKRKSTSKQKTRKKKIIKIIVIIAIILILILGIVLGVSAYQWKKIMQDMFVNENSLVVDSDGKTIAKLGSERKKIKVDLKNMPENLKNAYVSIEDERFYKHHGVDIRRTASAIVSYIFHAGSSSYGGSTITQQLVKNLTGDNTDSVLRKVREWWKAYLLESYFSKDEILEMYLNVIYVGPNIYGVEAGSQYYFNKQVGDLSLAECAFLAGINNSPNSYNPFGDGDNTEKITKRTKTVLAKMKELEYINEDEYNTAVSEVDNGLNFKQGEVESADGIYSYHTDALITEIVKDIAEKKNITEDFATNYIYMAGLTINSTQNSSIQSQTETEMAKGKYKIPSRQGGDSAQGAMVIIDHSTGHVLSCVGELGTKTTARGFNRATQSTRQTGSSIKPIAVLAPGIDKKKFTASTIYADVQKTFEGNYSPVNYDGYLGETTVRRAVESSQNIPFVEMMEEIKPKNSIKYLEKMGITTLTETDENLALALGGLDKGISPLEMAGAYATIANDGVYIEPTFYTNIKNQSGEEIIKASPKKKRVFSEQVAYILKEILIQPVKGENGTARYCAISGIDVAAKTGTTDENYDRWLCGFSTYYTAVTWFGFDQNETVYFNKQNPAGLIWANVMRNIHSGLGDAKFKKPSWIDTKTICAETGEIANSGCPNTYEEYYLLGTAPKKCTKHQGSKINEDRNNNNSNTGTDTTNNQEIPIPDMTAEDVREESMNNTRNTVNNTVNSSNTTNNTNTSMNNNRTNTSTNTNSNRNNMTTNTNTNTSSNTNSSGNSSNTNETNTSTNTDITNTVSDNESNNP